MQLVPFHASSCALKRLYRGDRRLPYGKLIRSYLLDKADLSSCGQETANLHFHPRSGLFRGENKRELRPYAPPPHQPLAPDKLATNVTAWLDGGAGGPCRHVVGRFPNPKRRTQRCHALVIVLASKVCK